jgi:hypothetical protein
VMGVIRVRQALRQLARVVAENIRERSHALLANTDRACAYGKNSSLFNQILRKCPIGVPDAGGGCATLKDAR